MVITRSGEFDLHLVPNSCSRAKTKLSLVNNFRESFSELKFYDQNVVSVPFLRTFLSFWHAVKYRDSNMSGLNDGMIYSQLKNSNFNSFYQGLNSDC